MSLHGFATLLNMIDCLEFGLADKVKSGRPYALGLHVYIIITTVSSNSEAFIIVEI